MAVIFADTNRFLRFYDANEEQLKVLADMVNESSRVVLTEQVVNEFKRNRLGRLEKVREQFDKSTQSRNPHYTSLLADLQAYKPLQEAAKNYDECAESVRQAINDLITNTTSDAVAKAFDELSNALSQRGRVYPISEEAITRAYRRKLLGNPPTSPNQHTIGDEVIWETLLLSCKDDLVICSGDNTFVKNEALLKEEYANKNGHRLIAVCAKFTDALKIVGETPSPELVKNEDALEYLVKQLEAVHDKVKTDTERIDLGLAEVIIGLQARISDLTVRPDARFPGKIG
jgi:tetratricopeptide (TPR) repeat protein